MQKLRSRILSCISLTIISLLIVVTTSAISSSAEVNDASVETETATDVNSYGLTAGVSMSFDNSLLVAEYLNSVEIDPKEYIIVGSTYETDEESTETETEEEEPVVEEVVEDEHLYVAVDPYTMYVGDSLLNERNTPSAEDDNTIINILSPGTEVTVIGTRTDDEWVAIQSSLTADGVAYVYGEYLQETSPESATYNWTWNGEVLNSQNGRVNGPSGSETYYNLDMSWIVWRMQYLGYEGEYWVRSDGVKMFGDYIMVAANFSIRPIGTILETSLGTAIVCDTGGFIYTYPEGIDIATTW